MTNGLQNLVVLLKQTLTDIRNEGGDDAFMKHAVLTAFGNFLDTVDETEFQQIMEQLRQEGFDIKAEFDEVIQFRKEELIKLAQSVPHGEIPVIESNRFNTSNVMLIGAALGVATGMWRNGVSIDTGVGGAAAIASTYFIKDSVAGFIDGKVESQGVRLGLSVALGGSVGYGGTVLGKAAGGLFNKSVEDADAVTAQLVEQGTIDAA